MECPLVVHYWLNCNRCTGFVAMTTQTYVSLYPYTLQMRIAPNAKCQRVLVLALWLVRILAVRPGSSRLELSGHVEIARTCSSQIGQIPARCRSAISVGPLCDQDSIMEFGLYWHLDPCSRLAAIAMGRKLGAPPLFGRGSWSPSSTMWPRPRFTSISSGILMHPAVWSQ